MKAAFCLCLLYSFACGVVLDACDLYQISALKLFFTNEVDPLLAEYGVNFKEESFLGQAYHFLDRIPVDKKQLIISNINHCSICTKKFSSKDYLALHYTLIHLQHQLSSQNLLRCPADLCSYFPCYKYYKPNPRAESFLLKRTQDCNENSEFRCAHDFSNAIDNRHPNATQFLLRAIGKFCLDTVCDEEIRKAKYNELNSDWKGVVFNICGIVGGVFVFLYYFVVCFLYADQKTTASKDNHKAK